MSWIEKITFQQTFPTGSFQNQKLGIEIAFDRDAEHEDAVKVYQLAKDLVNEAFQKMNPQLESSQNGNYASVPLPENYFPQQPLPSVDRSQEKTTTERVIEQINACTDLVVIDSFKLIAQKNPDIYDAYVRRRIEIAAKDIKNATF